MRDTYTGIGYTHRVIEQGASGVEVGRCQKSHENQRQAGRHGHRAVEGRRKLRCGFFQLPDTPRGPSPFQKSGG